MRTFLSVVLSCLLLSISGGTRAGDPADAILGDWLIDTADAKVQIYKCQAKYCGKIVWMKDPNYLADEEDTGKERVDKSNPDPAKRARKLMGMTMLWNFGFNGTDEWKGGYIYDPVNGKTYTAFMALDNPHRLKVRGYVLGIRLLGRTSVWTR